MKMSILKTLLPLLAVALVGVVFATSCKKDENTPAPVIPEESNDFLFVKSLVGKTLQNAEDTALGKGYTKSYDEDKMYYTTEDGLAKKLFLYSYTSDGDEVLERVAMSVRSTDTSVLKRALRKWTGEFKQATDLSSLTQESYFTRTPGSGFRSYSNLDSLLKDFDNIVVSGNDIMASCVDRQAYQYEFSLNRGNEVCLQIINYRTGGGTDTTAVIDSIVGRDRDMLLIKVDYLTYNYMGYTTLNVADKEAAGDTIPFVNVYMPPGDFGYEKLFYKDTNASNMLFFGTIIWMGCGQMNYPTDFVRGMANCVNLTYPGQQRIMMFNGTSHTTVSDETALRNIWSTVAAQEEFQWFYGRTSKKVAVYLYTPSVGVGNPADWYYLVFVENQ